MRLIVVFFTSIIFLTSVVFAHSQEIIRIKVNGLVCDFCARSTENVFYKQENIKQVTVDLDASLVMLVLKQGKTITDNKIKQLITDAGYSLEGIQRQTTSNTQN